MLIPVNFLDGVSVPQVLGFTIKIDTTLVSSGSSTANQYQLPLSSTGTYDMIVKWGDSTFSTITSWNQPEGLHTYAAPGIYTIVIEGTIIGWKQNTTLTFNDRNKLIEIKKFGNNFTINNNAAFIGCENLQITAIDAPIIATTDMGLTFQACTAFNSNINHWNMTGVTTMNSMFYRAYNFNQPLNSWDTSTVTNMSGMFYDANLFNQPLDNWNTGSVTNMSSMFRYAYNFDQPLNSWNTSNVTNMGLMFAYTNFNQPLNSWSVYNVINMAHMFNGAASFNQPLDMWDVSSLQNMSYMFANTVAFNSSLDNWTPQASDAMNMFENAQAFNGSMLNWDFSLSGGANLTAMFLNAPVFNQPLDSWNTSNVYVTDSMFQNATSFNQPVIFNDVINANYMFYGATAFNQLVTMPSVQESNNMFEGATNFNTPVIMGPSYMSYMFSNCTSFNQSLHPNFLSNVYNMSYAFTGASLFKQDVSLDQFIAYNSFNFYADHFVDETTAFTSTEVDLMYNGWLNTIVDFGYAPFGYLDIGTLQYTTASSASRQSLIDDYGWTILDGGQV